MSAAPSNVGYCVACGKESDTVRCAPCADEFRKAGGVRRVENLREYASGMRLMEILFMGIALSKFCRHCGEAIDDSRLRHSLIAYKRECYTCGTCSWKHK